MSECVDRVYAGGRRRVRAGAGEVCRTMIVIQVVAEGLLVGVAIASCRKMV